MTYARFVHLLYYAVALALCGLCLGRMGFIGGVAGILVYWVVRSALWLWALKSDGR